MTSVQSNPLEQVEQSEQSEQIAQRQIKEVRRLLLVQRLNVSPLAALAWAVFNEKPSKCITQIVSTCLALNSESFSAVKKARAIFNLIDFDAYYTAVPKEGTWLDRFNFILSSFAQTASKSQYRSTRLPLLLVESVVKEHIPALDMTMPSHNQRIAPTEIAFILKVICAAILKNHTKNDIDYCILARNYFLCEGQRQWYLQATKRRINANKLARISVLLESAHLIERTTRWTEEGKQAPNRYRMGYHNPFAKRLKKAEVKAG